MGVALNVVNFTRLFDTSTIKPIIINDQSTATEPEREKINLLISTKYEDTDLFSNEPTCDCGALKGGYNLGVLCLNCNTEVSEIFDKQLMSRVWMRSPIGVAPLINPNIWIMLTKKFVKSGFNLVEWMCNTNYQPAVNRPAEVDELKEMGVERGYNNFVTNFDHYINCLFSLKHYKEKAGTIDPLRQLLNMYRDCIFSNHLPLINKSLLVIEDTKVGVYVDPIIIGAIDAIRTISSIDSPLSNFTVREKENRTIKTIGMLSVFYYETYHEIIAGKGGLARKHIFGARNHWSTRAVISSNTKAHKYDELEIGWGHGCTMFKMHIVNKLFKLGYTPNTATELIQAATTMYHPLIDKIFKELIAESPNGGPACSFGRNPSSHL